VRLRAVFCGLNFILELTSMHRKVPVLRCDSRGEWNFIRLHLKTLFYLNLLGPHFWKQIFYFWVLCRKVPLHFTVIYHQKKAQLKVLMWNEINIHEDHRLCEKCANNDRVSGFICVLVQWKCCLFCVKARFYTHRPLMVLNQNILSHVKGCHIIENWK